MTLISNQRQQFILPKFDRYWLLFLGILTVYALLTVPTVSRMGIGWDEDVDQRIAQAYLTPRGFFFGIPIDLSQTRLPMFIVALVYRLSGESNLLIARLTSIVVGGLTILGIYAYGKDNINRKVGLLAAGLLAFNPFFLSFARLAFTESDVYLACILTWFLVIVARLIKMPSLGHAVVAGLFFGFCISAKATVLTILPALWVTLYYFRITSDRDQAESNVPTSNTFSALKVLLWSGLMVFVLLVGIYSARKLDVGNFSVILKMLNYGLVCLVWFIALGWAVRFRKFTVHPISIAAFVTGFGLLTFIIFPPDHLTNSGILRSLFLRADNEMSFNLRFMAELAALHLLTVFFKSTPVLGFFLISTMIYSQFQRRRSEVMLPILVGLSYFAGLLLLPLGQTFYTIPVLPVLSLLLADQFVRLRVPKRKVGLILTVLAVGWWGVEMIQTYPDYHLNGYQWLGKRVLFGRSSIGYRSVVYTPSDGVQQAVEWLNSNAKPEQEAQLYVLEGHVVRHFAPEPEYLLTNGFEETLISQPDYVVIHINAILWEGHGDDIPQGDVIRYPFDYELLTREYEQVFAVQRAFDLEMASVWQRK